MRTIHRYAQIFWVIAILLMAGGQAAHSFLADVDIHCESRQAETIPDTSVGDSHHCCHFHHSGTFLTSDSTGWTRPNFSGGDLSVGTVFVPESPLREIDYPPQLS